MLNIIAKLRNEQEPLRSALGVYLVVTQNTWETQAKQSSKGLNSLALSVPVVLE